MDKKYEIIYADPPWQFNNKKTGGSMKSGAAHHYLTTGIEGLKSMPGTLLLFILFLVPVYTMVYAPNGILFTPMFNFSFPSTIFTGLKFLLIPIFDGKKYHIYCQLHY